MKYNIKNRTIHVWLPNKLFKKLEEKIKERQEEGIKPDLKLAPAAYLLNLVVYIPYTRKDEFEDGWVPICSKANAGIYHFSQYMNFLVENKLLERGTQNYSTQSHKCKNYRLAKPYQNHIVKSIEVKGHKFFIKKRMQIDLDRKAKAIETTEHLTKWLKTEHFQVDYTAAMDFINTYYKGAGLIHKRNKRIMAIESLKSQAWGFSREGKDNRLHSLLTSLPKDLKHFVKYQNSSLGSIDIKNSQPFVFSSIIYNLLLNEDSNTSCNISTLLNNKLIPTMFYSFYNSTSKGALEAFVKEVQSGNFYENYGDVLFDEGILMMDCCGNYFLKAQTKSGPMIVDYDSLRNAGKDITMRTLFSSLNNHQNFIRAFKKNYPVVFEVMQIIKNQNASEKNHFPVLLQNIEADCVLDYCTKKIAEKYPDIPLFTIHDSIVTTESNIETVKNEFMNHLKDYFGIMPQLKIKSWIENSDLAA